MKKTFFLLLLAIIILPLFADNHLIDKGQGAAFIDISKIQTRYHLFKTYDINAGYTFRHGSSLIANYTHYQHELWELEYAPYFLSYNKIGLTYDLLINDQEKGKFPLDISVNAGYYYNNQYSYPAEYSDDALFVEHTLLVGINMSHDLKLFKIIEVIPLLSGKLLAHREVYNYTVSGSCMQTAELMAKLTLKYKFLYGFLSYNKEFNPYDCTSLYSGFNYGWQAGLGIILAH